MSEEIPSPDFICIGPHKTGTAWLYKTLSAHKEVKKSIIKELDYFLIQDIRSKGLLASVKYRKSHLSRIIKRRLISKNLRKVFSKSNSSRKRIAYHLRILLGLFSSEFYNSFFQKSEHQISGDISPAYFAISKSTIQKIKSDYPNIKIVVFLREPISRICSHVKMMHAFDGIPTNEINARRNIEFLKTNTEKGLYPFCGLQNWLSVFDESQIFIGFYDAFKKDPVSYYKKICRFLNISDQLESALNYKYKKSNENKRGALNFESPEDLLRHKYNSSKIQMEIPEAIIHSLVKHYYEDVRQLDNLIDSSYPKEWLSYYRSILSEIENEG